MRSLLNVARFAALVACVAGAIELLAVLVFFGSSGVVSRADLGQSPRPASDVLDPLLWTLAFGMLSLGLHLLYIRTSRWGGSPHA